MITKHYINGKPMSEEEHAKRMPCSLCNGGKDFDKKEYFKKDALSPDYEETSCSNCLTKYRKKRLEPNIISGTSDETLLKNLNIQLDEAEKMITNEEKEKIAVLHDKFSETGKCEEHIWKKTNPVVTAEGTFVFEACIICRLGRITYNGKTYQDDLNKLVNWIVNNGLTKEKKREEEMKMLGKISAKPDLSFDSLFEDDESENIKFV